MFQEDEELFPEEIEALKNGRLVLRKIKTGMENEDYIEV